MIIYTKLNKIIKNTILKFKNIKKKCILLIYIVDWLSGE
jgi:hypothetical protein